jgi:hypothetical protein
LVSARFAIPFCRKTPAGLTDGCRLLAGSTPIIPGLLGSTWPIEIPLPVKGLPFNSVRPAELIPFGPIESGLACVAEETKQQIKNTQVADIAERFMVIFPFEKNSLTQRHIFANRK